MTNKQLDDLYLDILETKLAKSPEKTFIGGLVIGILVGSVAGAIFASYFVITAII